MKSSPPTRAEGRRRRAAVPEAGIYGVDVTDAGADAGKGRYVCWASTAAEATERIRVAGFRKKDLQDHWTPRHPPRRGVPDGLGPDVTGWCRSRVDADPWTDWEVLPASYRHPSQPRAAAHP